MRALAYALRRSHKVVRGLKQGPSEEERCAVANHVIARLKERGDPWRLDVEAPTAKAPTARFASGRAIPPPPDGSSVRRPGLLGRGLSSFDDRQ
jgi:hypothetical protein